MASLFTSRITRASLLRLPPQVRLTAYRHSFERSFSASSPRKSILVDYAVAGPILLLDTLHDTLHFPWWLALPASACLVRGVFLYYLTVLPGRRTSQIQANLAPIVAAKARQLRRSPERYRKETELRNTNPAALKTAVYINELRDGFWARLSVERDFGVFQARIIARILVNVGTLITMTEAIRIKCASRDGLLSTLLNPFEGAASAKTAAPPPSDPAEALAQRLEAARSAKQDAYKTGADGDMLTQETQLQPMTPEPGLTNFDPTLETEGLSWCLDLTVPDPTFILPLTLSLALATNILLRPAIRASPASTPGATIDTFSRLAGPLANGQRIGLSLSVLFFFLALKMPAAILLYFVPSLVVGWLQQRRLDYVNPIWPAIQACRRPMRYKVQREWKD